MLGRLPTWLVVAGVVALLVAAAVDVLRPHRSSEVTPQERRGGEEISGEAPLGTVVKRVTSQLGHCRPSQLALRMERLGGDPALALAHVRGLPCRTTRLPIEVLLFDRQGKRVQATVGIQEAFAPTALSLNVEAIAPFNVVFLCRERRPVRAAAKAGRYFTGGRLPRSYRPACLHDLGP
jgi:hypothetical protein